MDDFIRLKIMLYQYILFKGDFYKAAADDALDILRKKKYPSSDDVYRFYYARLKYEIFNDFQKEIADILDNFLNP